MHVIDGKTLARTLREEVRERVGRLPRQPRLAVLLVGEDKASHLYVSLKKKAGEKAGIAIELLTCPSSTPDADLIAQIQTWNTRADVDAILVQLPLPPGHDENAVIAAIDPGKDVDGFHPLNTQALLEGTPTIVPPVHEGILRLMNEAPIDLAGKTAVVIANSHVFADPLARLLRTAGLFVHIMKPDELEAQTLRRADVVVIAIGRSHFLHAGITKKDAVIIDVGTNQDAQGHITGDVDLDTYAPYEAWVTPSPGGVGPMTIAQLLLNVVRLAEKNS